MVNCFEKDQNLLCYKNTHSEIHVMYYIKTYSFLALFGPLFHAQQLQVCLNIRSKHNKKYRYNNQPIISKVQLKNRHTIPPCITVYRDRRPINKVNIQNFCGTKKLQTDRLISLLSFNIFHKVEYLNKGRTNWLHFPSDFTTQCSKHMFWFKLGGCIIRTRSVYIELFAFTVYHACSTKGITISLFPLLCVFIEKFLRTSYAFISGSGYFRRRYWYLYARSLKNVAVACIRIIE